MTKWDYIENIIIYMVILGCTIAGFAISDTANGLWSMLLLFAVNYNKTKK